MTSALSEPHATEWLRRVEAALVWAGAHVARSFGARHSGSGQVMFGSDTSPTVIGRFAENLDPIKGLNVPDSIKDKLLGGNAARLLKL